MQRKSTPTKADSKPELEMVYQNTKQCGHSTISRVVSLRLNDALQLKSRIARNFEQRNNTFDIDIYQNHIQFYQLNDF